MRVLQVAPYLPPYPGGQERHVASLARALARRGHEVRVLTTAFPRGGSWPIDGVAVTRVATFGRPLRNPIAPGALFARSLYRWADVIHLHNEHAFPSVAATIAGRSRPRVLTCHGDLRFGSFGADAIERAYTRTIGRSVMRACDRVIALTASERRRLVELGVPHDRVAIVPNAIDLRAPPSAEAARDWRLRRGFAEEPLVLFVGPLLARKRPDALVRAWPRVLHGEPRARAIFLGEGEERAGCERLARALGVQQSILFAGHVSDAERDLALAAADALAFTSMSEGLPGTLVEAVAAGTPVVAVDIPTLREPFADAIHLVDLERLPDALLGVLSDRHATRERAHRARKMAEAFDWKNVAPRIERVYEEAAG